MRCEFKAIVSFEDDIPLMMDGWLRVEGEDYTIGKTRVSHMPNDQKIIGSVMSFFVFKAYVYYCWLLFDCSLHNNIDGTDVICLQLLVRLLHPCGLLKCVEVILIFIKYKYSVSLQFTIFDKEQAAKWQMHII